VAIKKKPAKIKKVGAPLTAADLTKALKPFMSRFDGIDKRFDDVDKRFVGIDKRFDESDKRFDGIDKRFIGIDKRLDLMDNELKGVKREVVGVRVLVEQLDQKFMDALMPSEMTTEHNLAITDHENRIGSLEHESTAVKAAIKTLKEV
jgi:archaellum component FlaC